MKILLPVDGSPFTKRMLAWLVTHEEWLAASHEYTVLTVVPMIPPHAASMFPADQLKSYYEDTAEAIFKPIRKFTAKHDLATAYVSKIGHAPEVIAKMADKGKFDLVIMGSHGHSNLMNLVTGSVATRVLATSKVPVLLVR
ncbi:nucleotide-binding universal stress UspA family protein [Aquabacterium commune]|jgi:nucleotide-binding universal stress UspA family protein|uniref:Nucleotide-binding universal stress UspA family protein n=1 Tax=Aquabacterium commune TaxID=70586 RepID=A0A4R6R4N5_9BURK|nr:MULTISPECIES: universal stress protein [Aquabacterium]MBT9608861.1 universal stress protein [Aquabacterium sp.]TDP80813.1 nucleotide-binding universal stress UspA family protein [Aquabacterium commune]